MPTKQSGYMALSLVVAVIVVGLIITTTTALLSIGEARTSLSHLQGEEGFWFGEGCVEEGLWQSFRKHYYSGGDITHPEGNCSIGVTKNGTTWTLTATNNKTSYSRSFRVTFTRTAAGITIQKWEEY